MKATERLWLTANQKRLVPEGHKDAATLYAAAGDEIPESAVERFKLVDGTLKSRAAAANKAAEEAANKAAEEAANKAAEADSKKAGGLTVEKKKRG